MENPFIININTKLYSGDIVARTAAYDADSANTLTYTIKSSSSPIPFVINPVSGEISVSNWLQPRNFYTFTVVAEDSGTPRKRSELMVHVRALDGQFTLTTPEDQLITSVDEGPVVVGRDIASFSVKNSAEHFMTYSIMRGNYENSFCIDVTGSLYAVRELDRESRANYMLSVSVSNGQSSEISDVYVTINDVDDHRPRFPNDVITMSSAENMNAQKIGSLIAQDPDLGNVTYGVVGTSRGSYRYEFGMNEGILMMMRALDREKESRHVLTIVAEDGGSHKTFTRAVVLVQDKNDNAPQFVSRDYIQRIPMSCPKRYLVLQCLATDMDSGLNGKIRYV